MHYIYQIALIWSCQLALGRAGERGQVDSVRSRQLVRETAGGMGACDARKYKRCVAESSSGSREKQRMEELTVVAFSDAK